MMQRSNRKSHLQAPLSPATQALLRSEGPFSGASSSHHTSASRTPTSGDIPLITGSSTSSGMYTPEQGLHRALSAGESGTPDSTVQTSYLERPSAPLRTASASVLDSHDGNTYGQPTIMMPLRPAPPSNAPNGPLPPPPASFLRIGARRPESSKETNGNTIYPNGLGSSTMYTNAEGRPI